MLVFSSAKYPFLEISAPGQEEGCKVLDFGSVAVKASVEKHFEILNKSSVSQHTLLPVIYIYIYFLTYFSL